MDDIILSEGCDFIVERTYRRVANLSTSGTGCAGSKVGLNADCNKRGCTLLDISTETWGTLRPQLIWWIPLKAKIAYASIATSSNNRPVSRSFSSLVCITLMMNSKWSWAKWPDCIWVSVARIIEWHSRSMCHSSLSYSSKSSWRETRYSQILDDISNSPRGRIARGSVTILCTDIPNHAVSIQLTVADRSVARKKFEVMGFPRVAYSDNMLVV